MKTLQRSPAGIPLASLLLLGGLAVASLARAADPLGTEMQIDIDTSNPLGRDWFLKIQSNTYLLDADAQHTRRLEEVVQLQPRISVPLSPDLFLITRPTIPLFESKPYQESSGDLRRATGFSDIEVPMALSPTLGPSWFVGAGPTFTLPTATSDHTGSGKWQAGPSAALGWTGERWLAGIFVQQFWSFAGSGERENVSRLKAQYFLSWFSRDGWSIGMSPTINVNWKAASGQQLTFPVGLGASRTVKLSEGFAVKLGVQLEYMPIHPDALGQEANLQVTIEPVMAQPFRRPLSDRRLFGP